jgi:sulfatase maturation enzyme AslB (radical SAM superfamily)
MKLEAVYLPTSPLGVTPHNTSTEIFTAIKNLKSYTVSLHFYIVCTEKTSHYAKKLRHQISNYNLHRSHKSSFGICIMTFNMNCEVVAAV